MFPLTVSVWAFVLQGMILSDDDSAFTTEWELKVARKKVRMGGCPTCTHVIVIICKCTLTCRRREDSVGCRPALIKPPLTHSLVHFLGYCLAA